jgi:hypothetical protein
MSAPSQNSGSFTFELHAEMTSIASNMIFRVIYQSLYQWFTYIRLLRFAAGIYT